MAYFLNFSWLLLTSLQRPRSHHSLKYGATLSYPDHCNSFPSALPTGATGTLSSIPYIMSSFPFTRCTFDHVIHKPKPFKKLCIAVMKIKTQHLLVWPLTPFWATLLCHSPAPLRFSGYMNFLLISWADVLITNYSRSSNSAILMLMRCHRSLTLFVSISLW